MSDTFTASFDKQYEPDPHREGDDFTRVAQEFDGDLKDPEAFWGRVTNERTGESKLIDTEDWSVIGHEAP